MPRLLVLVPLAAALVSFDGNGSIPPETRQRYGIPADYGG
jgi:hypothetical protein